MTVLDLFRGAGGWSVACQSLGLRDLGVENMKEANATAAAMGHELAWHDVWNPDLTLMANLVITGLIGSPPCQTFSTAGKGSGRQALDAVRALVPLVSSLSLDRLRANATYRTGDERTALVLTPLWYALRLMPEWIALEQVPTALPVWEAIAEVLREHGYSVWTGVLHAEQYGVPQTRKRAFLIASRVREVDKPSPTHSKYYPRDPKRMDEGVLPWISMAQALGWREDLVMRSNYGTGGDPQKRGERGFDQPAPSITSKIDRNLIYPTVLRGNQKPDGGVNRVDENGYIVRPTDEPAITVTSNSRLFLWRDDLPEWAHRRPSTTIVGSFKPEIVAAPGYRTTVSRQNAEGSVRVTVQEAGVLQSFPADYQWQGARGKQFLQAGNAVPPLLARPVIAEAAGISLDLPTREAS